MSIYVLSFGVRGYLFYSSYRQILSLVLTGSLALKDCMGGNLTTLSLYYNLDTMVRTNLVPQGGDASCLTTLRTKRLLSFMIWRLILALLVGIRGLLKIYRHSRTYLLCLMYYSHVIFPFQPAIIDNNEANSSACHQATQF